MLAALAEAARATPDLHQLHTEPRDLFRRPLQADELKGFDGLCIDPPRAGAEAQTAQIARSSVPVLAAVSCNPLTFARDAETLSKAGYQIDWIEVIDRFRWSAHVELVARLSRV